MRSESEIGKQSAICTLQRVRHTLKLDDILPRVVDLASESVNTGPSDEAEHDHGDGPSHTQAGEIFDSEMNCPGCEHGNDHEAGQKIARQRSWRRNHQLTDDDDKPDEEKAPPRQPFWILPLPT